MTGSTRPSASEAVTTCPAERDGPAPASALHFDRDGRRVWLGGRLLNLGGRAFDLLAALADEPGAVWSARALTERVWPRQCVADNNLRVHIATLRRQLGRESIVNIPRRGYALNASWLRSLRLPGAIASVQVVAPNSRARAAVQRHSDRDAPPTLRGSDFLAMHRLLGECLELWADPAGWQQHLLAGLSKLIGLPVGLHVEVLDLSAGGQPVVLDAHEHGWLEPAHRLCFKEGHAVGGGPFEGSPLDLRFRDVARRGRHVVRVRADLMADREWQRCDFNQRVHRPAGMHEMVYSAIRSGSRHHDMFVFGGPGHRPQARDRLILGLVHGEVVELLRTRLAAHDDVSMAGLGPVERVLLQAALSAASEAEIAHRLQLPLPRLRRQLERLFDHFEVGDRLGLMAYFVQRRSVQRASAKLAAPHRTVATSVP